jgi:hypothetical protein
VYVISYLCLKFSLCIVCNEEEVVQMPSTDLKVHYQGEALKNNQMSVEDLAPSLLALAAVLKQIQQIYNPEEKPLSLDIKATDKGSFIVDLILSTPHEIISILSGDAATAGANLLAYVTAFGGLIALIKKAATRKIKANKVLKSGDVRLTFDDGTELTIPSETLRAYKSVEVRRSMDKVVEPTRKQGIESVQFESAKKESYTISKQDADAFIPPEVPEKEFEPVVSEEYLQLITVSFQKGGKWKFSDGANQFYAAIEDEDFVRAVMFNQDRFGSTDTLKVRLRKTQTMTEKGLKSDVVIEKVLQHIPGSKQLQLNLGNQNEDSDK